MLEAPTDMKPNPNSKRHASASLAITSASLAITSVSLAVAIGLGFALAACTKDEPAPPPRSAPVENVALEPQIFTPPDNGLLTDDQIGRFILAHAAMVEVNDLYLDSLVGTPPEKQRGIYQALDIARDKVTRKFGLNGYAEYRWILEDAPRHPANVRILERMKVTTVTP